METNYWESPTGPIADEEQGADSMGAGAAVWAAAERPDLVDRLDLRGMLKASEGASEARWVAERIRGEFHLIPGAGHYPHAEFPRETAQILLSFLAR